MRNLYAQVVSSHQPLGAVMAMAMLGRGFRILHPGDSAAGRRPAMCRIEEATP